MRGRNPEEELLLKRQDEIQEQTLDSTKRMLDVLDDTERVAKETLYIMDDQGRQIRVTTDNVDDLLYREEIAKRQVRTISSILWQFYYWIAPWAKRPDHNLAADERVAQLKEFKKKYSDENSVEKDVEYPDVILPGLRDKAKKTHQQIEKNLDEIQDRVEDLGEMADAMGDKAKAHNERLDTLSDATNEARDKQDENQNKISHVLRRF